MAEGVLIDVWRHRCLLAIIPDQGIIGDKDTNAKCARMYREEACIEKIMKMLHKENTISTAPGTLPGLLKSTRTVSDRIVAVNMPTGDRIQMIVLLRYNMASLDTGPYYLSRTP